MGKQMSLCIRESTGELNWIPRSGYKGNPDLSWIFVTGITFFVFDVASIYLLTANTIESTCVYVKHLAAQNYFGEERRTQMSCMRMNRNSPVTTVSCFSFCYLCVSQSLEHKQSRMI
jgi:hypothetical protein